MNNLTDNIEYSLQQYAAMTQAQLLNAPHLPQQQQQQQQHSSNNNDRQQSNTQSSPMSHLQDPNHAFSLAYQPFPLIRMAPPQLHQPTLAKELSASATSSTSLDLGMHDKSARPTRVTRPPNAYLLFNKEMRRILKDQDPTMKVADISKEVGFRWKTMPKEQKEQYVNQANKIKEEQRALHPNSMYIRRSRAELLKAGHFSKGNPADQPADPHTKRKRPKRDKNTTTPKHPLSAYMWYLAEVRPDAMRQYPGSNVGQISKLCADRWNVMSEEARLPWKTKAQVDKDRYAREMQIYAIQNDHALGRGTRQKYRSAAAALRRSTTPSSTTTATPDVFLDPLFYSDATTTATGKPPSYLSAAPAHSTSSLLGTTTTLPTMAPHTLNPHALLQQQQQQQHSQQHSNNPSASTSTSSASTSTHSSTSTAATVYSDHLHC